uniref:SPRY domain-containing protein n=1 Tax=Globodera rostochiensis TaxID=31243 RepID=A0A914HPE4_GLORO
MKETKCFLGRKTFTWAIQYRLFLASRSKLKHRSKLFINLFLQSTNDECKSCSPTSRSLRHLPKQSRRNLNLVPNDATIFAAIYEMRMKILDMESEMNGRTAASAVGDVQDVRQNDEVSSDSTRQPNCVIAQHHGTKKGFRSVRADSIVARQFGIFYYELPEHRPRHKALALDECVGRHKNSFSYANKGRFWKDGTVDGGNSKFGVDDVVGYGVNLATRQIFYALNGKRLYTAKALDCPMDLFLCVSLEEPGDSVETNFGPNFKFNLADEFEELGPGK